MKTLTKILISFLLVFTLHIKLYTLHSYAAVPHLINYQGRLTDSGGTPLNGSYQLTFRIYDAETAGNLLWEETHSGVVIQKGIFGILLGSVTNLNLPFDKQYYLEIKVGTEVMSPRQRITSAGYAIRAEKAEKAERLTDASAIDSGTIPTARLGSGSADATKFLRGDQSWTTVSGFQDGNVATILQTSTSIPYRYPDWVDVSGASVSITLNSTGKIVAFFSGEVKLASGGDHVRYRIVYDNTQIASVEVRNPLSYTKFAVGGKATSVPAGTYTVKLQADYSRDEAAATITTTGILCVYAW